VTIEHQRAERQRLAGRPIDIGAGLDRFAAVFNKAAERLVEMEILRQRSDLLADLFQFRNFYASVAAARIVAVTGAMETGPAAVEPIGLVGAITLRRLKLDIEPLALSFSRLRQR
jgi:hypothetical protein